MKLQNYLVLLTFISMVLALGGLNVAGISALFSYLGLVVNSSGVGQMTIDSTFWNYIFGTAGLLTSISISGAIGVGTFIYTKDKSFLILPIITGVFVYWISVMISIINYSLNEPIFGTIIAIILVPLTLGFIISCVDWFMGRT
ncbi:MAG TPA: hypothetical protein ENI61_00680 [Ignavibacteria bacterium]|nr:hypothetical protein [Ignavibacteria bacterium]